MSYFWVVKSNNATSRRIEKLNSEGINVDTSTHGGRKTIGYNYLKLATED